MTVVVWCSSRVIHLSSVMHRRSSNAQLFSAMKADPGQSRNWYPHTKYAQVLFSFELHRRYFSHPAGSVASIAVNPGAVWTDIWRHIPPPISWIASAAFWLLFLNSKQGSETSVFAAEMPVEEGRLDYVSPYPTSSSVTWNAASDYWSPFGAHPQRSRANEDAYSAEAAETLWMLCQEQMQSIKGEPVLYEENDD